MKNIALNKKIVKLVLVTLLAVGLGFGCAATQKAATPPKAKAPSFAKYPQIADLAFVKKQVIFPAPKNVMIIDARPKRAKYDKGHIPNAVSIPDSKFAKMTDLLPENKAALLIFYCGGLKCPLSHKSAFKAEKLGYTNIRVFAEGYPKWLSLKDSYRVITTDYLSGQMKKKAKVVVVDSRPKRAKYDKGHIQGAISIPDSKFAKMTDQLPADKATELVFYCGGLKCPLSHKSAKKALALGYTNVKVYAQGFPAWKAMLAETGASPAPKAATVVKAGTEEGSIDMATFLKTVKENPQAYYLIDVRDPAEFATGSFKTSKNIPVDKLEARINSLPTNIPVVFVCSTGARSGESYYMVQDIRPDMKNVYYLEAEVTFNEDGSYLVEVPKG